MSYVNPNMPAWLKHRYELIEAMHKIMLSMNDEYAYEAWIQNVPDEADENDLLDIAEDDETFMQASVAFRGIIRTYGRGGFCIQNSDGHFTSV